MSFADFKTNYDAMAEEHCKPATFCSWDEDKKSCGCALGMSDKVYNQCQAVCSVWTQKDVDCPKVIRLGVWISGAVWSVAGPDCRIH